MAFGPIVPLLGIYPKGRHNVLCEENTKRLTATLFVVGNNTNYSLYITKITTLKSEILILHATDRGSCHHILCRRKIQVAEEHVKHHSLYKYTSA